MTTQENLAVPTVHLNGTSKEALLDQISDALAALAEAHSKLSAAAPNARDYYMQGLAFGRALSQHVGRVKKIQSVIAELQAIGEKIADQ